MEKYYLLIVLYAFIFGAFSAYLAKEKKRDAGSWFFLGLFFNLVALITIAGLPIAEQRQSNNSNISNATRRVDQQTRKITTKEKVLRILLLLAVFAVLILIGVYLKK